jgi:hypothetical protein
MREFLPVSSRMKTRNTCSFLQSLQCLGNMRSSVGFLCRFAFEKGKDECADFLEFFDDFCGKFYWIMVENCYVEGNLCDS